MICARRTLWLITSFVCLYFNNKLPWTIENARFTLQHVVTCSSISASVAKDTC